MRAACYFKQGASVCLYYVHGSEKRMAFIRKKHFFYFFWGQGIKNIQKKGKGRKNHPLPRQTDTAPSSAGQAAERSAWEAAAKSGFRKPARPPPWIWAPPIGRGCPKRRPAISRIWNWQGIPWRGQAMHCLPWHGFSAAYGTLRLGQMPGPALLYPHAS